MFNSKHVVQEVKDTAELRFVRNARHLQEQLGVRQTLAWGRCDFRLVRVALQNACCCLRTIYLKVGQTLPGWHELTVFPVFLFALQRHAVRSGNRDEHMWL
jgi:hypothetical protein